MMIHRLILHDPYFNLASVIASFRISAIGSVMSIWVTQKPYIFSQHLKRAY